MSVLLYSDVQCGQLMCFGSTEMVNFARQTLLRLNSTVVGAHPCYGALIDVGSQTPSPAYVPNGAQCDSGKVN